MIEHPAVAAAAFLIAIGLLAQGAKWLVLSSVQIARRFGLSELVIGLTVVALGTSAPEFMVTVLAAIEEEPAISIGNVVGSNIFNTGLVLGLCSVIWRIPCSADVWRRDVPLLVVGTTCVLLFVLDGRLDRLEGLLLFALLAGYLGYLIRRGSPAGVALESVPRAPARASNGPLLLLGLACVLGGARLMVESSLYTARALGVSEWLIGVTIVAGGTSLPEFATSVMAGRHGHRGIIIGSLVGSDLFNLLGVLGLAALLRPLAVDQTAFLGLAMLLVAVVVLWLAVFRRAYIAQGAGLLLVLVALGRWLLSA